MAWYCGSFCQFLCLCRWDGQNFALLDETVILKAILAEAPSLPRSKKQLQKDTSKAILRMDKKAKFEFWMTKVAYQVLRICEFINRSIFLLYYFYTVIVQFQRQQLYSYWIQ